MPLRFTPPTKELAASETWTIRTAKEDKYGRYLGLLYSGDETTSLNDRMVQLGMASPFMVDRND
jgi:endonuclease YncB( thermonuclease family)